MKDARRLVGTACSDRAKVEKDMSASNEDMGTGEAAVLEGTGGGAGGTVGGRADDSSDDTALGKARGKAGGGGGGSAGARGGGGIAGGIAGARNGGAEDDDSIGDVHTGADMRDAAAVGPVEVAPPAG